MSIFHWGEGSLVDEVCGVVSVKIDHGEQTVGDAGMVNTHDIGS